MNGYINLFRKFTEWEWYKNQNTKDLFIHCLLKANWKDAKFEGITVKRGSFITSLDKLNEETGIPISQVRTALKHLISTNNITSKTTNKFRVITIVNYEEYQIVSNQNDNQITINSQSNDNQLATNEKEKKEINIYNNNIYELIEKNFGRTLSSIEFEMVSKWQDSELTRYAIKQAVLNGKFSIKYIQSILFSYEKENIKTVQQAQEREIQFKNRNANKNQMSQKEDPFWFNQENKTETITKEEEEEINNILENLCEV